MLEMTVKEVWDSLTLPEREDACLAFCEGKDAFSQDARPRVLQELATKLKFREATLKRLPLHEKARYLRWQADSPSMRHVCDDILRSWMASRKNPILICFVEAQGLNHAQGILEDSTPAPTAGAVKKGIRAVRDHFPPREVALYLGFILAAGAGFWTGLADAVDAEFPGLKAAMLPPATPEKPDNGGK